MNFITISINASFFFVFCLLLMLIFMGSGRWDPWWFLFVSLLAKVSYLLSCIDSDSAMVHQTFFLFLSFLFVWSSALWGNVLVRKKGRNKIMLRFNPIFLTHIVAFHPRIHEKFSHLYPFLQYEERALYVSTGEVQYHILYCLILDDIRRWFPLPCAIYIYFYIKVSPG